MRIWPFIVLTLVTASPGKADTVYLTNGGSFEGVMADVAGSKVNIRMQGGVLSLPLAQVARIESGESSLAQYLNRKEALQRSATATAGTWLELATWAQGKGLNQASREAALVAAQIDPTLPGLAAMMRSHGYVLDATLGRFIPYSDAMRRKGFVQSNGQWIARAEFEAAERAREAEAEERRARQIEAQRAAREERLAQLTELALARESRRAEISYQTYYPPVIVLPGFVPSPIPFPMPHDGDGNGKTPSPEPKPRDDDRSTHSTFTRVPGSLIPGRYPTGPTGSPDHP